jgi:hypothetical protein
VTWAGIDSPSCDVRSNPFVALDSGAAICGYAHAHGGETALRKVLKLVTSIGFPRYALAKAILDLLQAGLDDVASIVFEYVERTIPTEDLHFCPTNVKFLRRDERCNNPEFLCGECASSLSER